MQLTCAQIKGQSELHQYELDIRKRLTGIDTASLAALGTLINTADLKALSCSLLLSLTCGSCRTRSRGNHR